MKVPKRKYYPLSEAAEILDCNVNDLIFHGVHGNIELCVHVQLEIDSHYHKEKKEWELGEVYYFKKSNYVVTHFPEIILGNPSPYVAQLVDELGDFKFVFSSDILLISESGYGVRGVKFPPLGEDYIMSGMRMIKINGLLAIPQHVLKDYEVAITKGEEVIGVYWDIPKDAIKDDEQSNPIEFTPKAITGFEYPISKQDIYITLNEMEKISKKIDGNDLTQKQSRFIYDLLAIHYGNDVAENPRRFIDDPNSEISKDFSLKGDLPSGRSVERWLKKVL